MQFRSNYLIPGIVVSLGLFAPVLSTTHTWDALSAGNASTAANWSTNAVPSSGDTIVFDVTSAQNCTWDLAVNPGNVRLEDTYTGTVTIGVNLTVNGDLNVNGGTMDASGHALTCHAFSIGAAGTFTAPASDTMTVHGDWTNDGTFLDNGGIVKADPNSNGGVFRTGGTGGGNDFNDLVITKMASTRNVRLFDALEVGGDLTVKSGGTLEHKGNNLTVSGDMTVKDGCTVMCYGGESVSISGTLSWEPGSQARYGDSPGTYTGLPYGNVYHDLRFHRDGGIWILSAPLDINGDLSITRGTLDCNGHDVTVAGNWSNGATIDYGSNTVTFDGGDQYISGNNTFHNLTKTVTSSSVLVLPAGGTQTVTSTLTLKGVDGGLLSLRSSISGSQWNIDPQGTRDCEYLNVQDGNNLRSPAVNPLHSVDAGNNTEWFWKIIVQDDNGITNDPDPAIEIQATDADSIRFALLSDTTAWREISTPDSIDISLSGDGGKRIWAQIWDVGSGLKYWTSDSTTYDITPPTLVVENDNSNGPYSTASWSSEFGDEIRGTASDALSPLDSVEIAIYSVSLNMFWDGAGWASSSAVWHKATGTTNWTLPMVGSDMPDGIDTIYARGWDRMGNVNASSARSWVEMDNASPSNLSIAISDNDGYTNDPTPSLSFTYTDADSMRIGVDSDTITKTWKPVTATDAIDISGGDGTKYVSVQFMNKNGNRSSWIYDSTVYDGTPPSSVAITNLSLGNYNASTWPGSISGSSADATSGVSEVYVWVRNGTTGMHWNGASWVSDSASGWVLAGGTTSWALTLASGSLSEATYTVRARAVDRAGNAASTVGSFSYDDVAPTCAVSVTDRNGYTSDSDPALTITTTSADSMKIGLAADTAGVGWEAYSSSDSIAISAGGEGPKSIFVRLKDVAGNLSPWTSAQTVYDVTNPVSEITTSGSYNAQLWPGAITGTAGDSISGIEYVVLRIYRENPVGYWNGSSWSATPSWLSATLTSDTTWSYSLLASSLTDGTYALTDSVVDSAGNASTSSGSFGFSNTGPSGGTIKIGDLNGFTKDPTPPCTLSIGDPTNMRIRIALTADTATADTMDFQSVVDTINIAGAGGDRGARIWVQYLDELGNPSIWVSDTTTYDETAPGSAVSTSGAHNGSSWGGSIRGTSYDYTSGVDAVDIKIQNQGTGEHFQSDGTWDTTEVWHRASGTTDWSYPFPSGNLTDGLYRVGARAVDRVGNIQSNYGTGEFSYDNSAPGGGSITITDKSGFTKDPTPLLRLQVNDAAQMRLAVASDTSVWKIYVGQDSIDISGQGDGVKKVSVQFRDSVGNISGWYHDSTVFDATLPLATLANKGQSYTETTWPDTVRGTAFDGTSGIDSLYVAIRENATGRWWDGSGGWLADTNWLRPGTRQQSGIEFFVELPMTYLSDGTYRALSYALDKAGNRQSAPDSATFSFYRPPTANFVVDPRSTRKNEVLQARDSSTGMVTSWFWSFGNGQTSTEQHPSYTYADTGTFDISLVVSGPGGKDTLVRSDYIKIYGPGQNTVFIEGTYLSDTLVELRYSDIDALTPYYLNTPDSLRLWRRVGEEPVSYDPTKDQLAASYKVSSIPHVNGEFTDTIIVPALPSTDSIYGFMTQVTWVISPPTPFSGFNGTAVLMKDTLRPTAELTVSAQYAGCDSVRVMIDSLQKLTGTNTASIGIWYGFTSDANFSASKTVWLDADSVRSVAVNNRAVLGLSDAQFEGVEKRLYIRSLLKGGNGLLGRDTARTSLDVGWPRPENTVLLESRVISSGTIRLKWPYILGADSILIWYGTNGVPLDTSVVSGSGYQVITPSVYDTMATADGLLPNTRYYFGLQYLKRECSTGLWSNITASSSVDDSTPSPDNVHIANTIAIRAMWLDTATNEIKISWEVDNSDDIAKEYGTTYGLGTYLDPSNTPLRYDAVPGDSNTTVLRLNEPLVFDTLYCVSMWLRRSGGGAGSAPTDTSKDTLRTPSFTWQNVAFGSANQVSAFNGTIQFFNDAGTTGDLPSNVIRHFDPSDSLLNGLVVVGEGFFFQNAAQSPPFTVGIKYDAGSIPSGFSSSDIRVYRLTPTGMWLVEDNVMLDNTNQLVKVALDASKGDNLAYPFIALIDSTVPSVAVESDTSDAIAVSQTVVYDTLDLSDNIANLTWRLWYARGGDDLFGTGPDSTGVLDSTSRRIVVRIATGGAADNGIRALLSVSDGVHTDTFDLSRQAVREKNEDVTPSLEWYPLRVSATLDSSDIKKSLGSLSEKGDWKYDNTNMRLFRWLPYEGNASTDDKYVEYGTVADSIFALSPGKLLWVKTKERSRFDLGSGTTVSLKDTVELSVLPQEWADCALPFQFSMKVGDILTATGSKADSVLQFYSWGREAKKTASRESTFVTVPLYIKGLYGTRASQIKGGAGIGWSVYNHSDDTVTIRIPAVPAVMSQIPDSIDGGLAKSVSSGTWKVAINGWTSAGRMLSPVYCGVSKGLSKNRYYPKSPSFDRVSVGVHVGRKMHGHCLAAPEDQEGMIFPLVIRNGQQTEDQVFLDIAAQYGIPENFTVALFDPVSGEWQSSSENGAYSVSVANDGVSYRFLAVGTNGFLDRFVDQFPSYRLGLAGLFPNPFRGALTIRYTIPYAGVKNLHFALFNAAGRVVWQRQFEGIHRPGMHALVWNGANERDQLVSSGTYILRMTAIEDATKKQKSFARRVIYLKR